MRKSYRLVVFDWEGTLGDTLGHVLSTVAMEASRLGFGTLDLRLARQSVAFGLAIMIKKSFPDLSLHQHERLIHAVEETLSAAYSDACLLPGAKEILHLLQEEGVFLAIATNKGMQSLQRVLQSSDMAHFFHVTRTAGETRAKPCPQMLEEIMTVCAIPASETLMIGDSIADMEMAAFVGVDAIGVDFYHQQKTELLAAGAIAVFDDYVQLADYLQLPHLVIKE
jgi:phosphoglycolate phosphatase